MTERPDSVRQLPRHPHAPQPPHLMVARPGSRKFPTASDLIWPVFVIEARTAEAVASMPGVTRYSVDLLVGKGEEAAELGIPAVALFPNTPAQAAHAGCARSLQP